MKDKNKKAISEIISYAILITITIGVSIGVYAWLKYQIPSCNENDNNCFLPVDCPEGTSIMINGYSCDSLGIKFILTNNGRFNVSGIILSVTDDASKIPAYYLDPIGSAPGGRHGQFIFEKPLSPNKEIEVSFSDMTEDNQKLAKIEEIKMQVFINNPNRKMCKNVVLRENLKNCIIPPPTP